MAIEIKTIDKKKIELKDLLEKINVADPFEAIGLSSQISPLLQAVRKEEAKAAKLHFKDVKKDKARKPILHKVSASRTAARKA